ncbi:MAG: GNAT family N-acetyltransferase [Gammaproteobacteria bacterium]|nr:GNAT family N-acetyltransferase [Gammaproteobacteria bacterium]
MSFVISQPHSEKEYKQYYQLRWKILRAPWKQPEGSEIDNIEEPCIHVMAVDTGSDNKTSVTGVARLQYNSATEAQIRYMAVAKEYERQGIGRELVNALEQYAQNSSCKKIVLHAREPAIGFYQKMGYRVIEKSYSLFNEIQHFRMVKELETNSTYLRKI